jgi:tetratricopeptide (TPR) repeat protein
MVDEKQVSGAAAPDDEDEYYEVVVPAWSYDRISRWLVGAIVVVAVVIVTGAVYLGWKQLTTAKTPQSLVERQMSVLESYVKKDPKNAQAQADYIRALMVAGQRPAALNQIQAALKATNSAPPIYLVQAQYYRSGNDATAALAAADKAVSAIADARVAQAKQYAKSKTTSKADAYSKELIQAQLMRGGIFASRQRNKEAADALTIALAEDPTMSDVLTARGDLDRLLGDKAAARADYEAALRYAPDYSPAKAGLLQLGK